MATRAAASLAAKDNAELILLRESISAFTVRFEALELKVEALDLKVEALELSNGLKDTKIQALEQANRDKDKKIEELEKKKTSILDTTSWVTVVSGKKKPAEQLAVEKLLVAQQTEIKNRENNIIVYGVEESKKETVAQKIEEDKLNVTNILKEIGKEGTVIKSVRRFKSKSPNKPGPILIEVTDLKERNKLLLASKALREKSVFKNVYLSPDLTEAERLLDYDLRKKRNELNNGLDANSPFRYAIRGNQVVRFKKQQI